MALPADYNDSDKNYRVRVVMRVAVNPTIGFITGSIVGVCDDCGEAVWIDEKQVVPPLPEDMPLDGDLVMCFQCLYVRSQEDGTAVEALNQMTTDELRMLGIETNDPLT